MITPSPALQRAARQCANALQKRGCEIVEWQPPRAREAIFLQVAAMSADGGARLRRELSGHPIDPVLLSLMRIARMPGFLRRGIARGLRDELPATTLRTLGRKPVEELWSLTSEIRAWRFEVLESMERAGIDLIVSPAFATPALPHLGAAQFTLAASLSMLWNIAQLPAGVIPVTRVRAEETKRAQQGGLLEKLAAKVDARSEGLPVGAQIVGRPWQDEQVLAAMEAAEEELPPAGFSPRPYVSGVRYLALATDYDGTLAHDGQVREETFAALEKLRASGRRVILVTGRELDDLEKVCPRLDLFDRIVAENGALLYGPQTREEVLLAKPPPPELAARLREKNATPLSCGRVIVATREPHEVDAIEAVRDLGLEMQVIFNKGAVMILPSGVNKETGLRAALGELGLSLKNTVAVGDAENDHAMLVAAECGAAVSNSISSLKDQADIVTRRARGEGVEELIGRLLDDDLHSLVVPRHALLIGQRRDGSELRIRPTAHRVLIAGPSGSGKSTAATGIIERLMVAGYQVCVIDPEGDYEGFEGLVEIGTSERPPTVEEVLELLSKPEVNVGVSLLSVPLTDRPSFFAALLPRLQEMRSRLGRPHWIVADEAHHLFPAAWEPAELTLPRDLGGLLLITVHPERLAPSMVGAIDLALAVGDDPEDTLGAVRDGEHIAEQPADGEVVFWQNGVMEPLKLLPGKAQHRRHRRKYAAGNVPERFVFRGPEGKLSLQAQNLQVFLQMADGVDDETWAHHLRQNDYSKWFREAIKDADLADEAKLIESGDPALSKAAIREAIEARYTLPE